RMRSGNCNLGGEQSGHIVLSDYSTTGDGLMAALQVLHIIQASGKPASQVCRPFEPRPQLLENVKLNIGDPLRADAVKQVIAESERRLLGKGRLLIRKSGTEPLVRIMAEGEDRTLIASVVNEIVSEIERVV
ncbi:MAG TPA: phosphoglucosamine mutase, partial [Rhodospirillales bacterium]|nr:phosphoglucosamine mutase [Rhodospirillales bacterium]